MPRRKHHCEICEHCEGTGIRQFFHNVGDKIKKSFAPGGVMRKVGNEVVSVAKPFVRPVVNDLVNSGKTALQAVAPEFAPEIELGSQALQGTINKGLAKQGMGLRKGRFVKGSAEAKAHMAKIRAMRGKGLTHMDYIPAPHSRMP
jgi:hypothetical protein